MPLSQADFGCFPACFCFAEAFVLFCIASEACTRWKDTFLLAVRAGRHILRPRAMQVINCAAWYGQQRRQAVARRDSMAARIMAANARNSLEKQGKNCSLLRFELFSCRLLHTTQSTLQITTQTQSTLQITTHHTIHLADYYAPHNPPCRLLHTIPVREGETIEGSRTTRNRPYPVLK